MGGVSSEVISFPKGQATECYFLGLPCETALLVMADSSDTHGSPYLWPGCPPSSPMQCQSEVSSMVRDKHRSMCGEGGQGENAVLFRSYAGDSKSPQANGHLEGIFLVQIEEIA